MNHPCTTIVTPRGPYIVEALLTRQGDTVAIYTLILPDNDDVAPMFNASDSRVPDAYTPDGDAWDAEKAFQLVGMWEERFNGDGSKRG